MSVSETPRTQPPFITLKYILSTAIVVTLAAAILGRNAQNWQGVDPSSSEDHQFGLLELARD
jgi:hypothetical protein